MKNLLVYSLTFFLIPLIAFGATTVRTGELVSVDQDQEVFDDFYGFGDSVVVSGVVLGDLLTLSSNMSVDGQVKADIFSAAGSVDIGGVVEDDVRLLAGDIEVSGEIKGDLVVVGKTLKILPDAKIAGDVMFFGAEANISGMVEGNILGNSERLRIDGEVKGELEINTGELTLGGRANIAGDVKYTSYQELVRAQDAQVDGDIVRNDPVVPNESALIKNALIVFLVLVFTALVMYLFLRGLLTRAVKYSHIHPMKSALLGFAVLFMLPFVSIILVLSTLGSVLGLMVLGVGAVLVLASMAMSGIIAGSYISKLNSGKDQEPNVNVFYVVLGMAVVFALTFVPVVGTVTVLALYLISLGALSVTVYKIIRQA